MEEGILARCWENFQAKRRGTKDAHSSASAWVGPHPLGYVPPKAAAAVAAPAAATPVVALVAAVPQPAPAPSPPVAFNMLERQQRDEAIIRVHQQAAEANCDEDSWRLGAIAEAMEAGEEPREFVSQAEWDARERALCEQLNAAKTNEEKHSLLNQLDALEAASRESMENGKL